MRIIGGKYKNRNFFMPAKIKPTQGLTRKAVFDLVGQDLTGLAFLDLFAGSGSVGLEAVSRGAKEVVFVENDEKCLEVLSANLNILGAAGGQLGQAVYEVMSIDAFAAIKLLSRMRRTFDIIFFDPPYGLELSKKVLKTLMAYDIMSPNCFIIAEHGKRETLPAELDEKFVLVTNRKYGISYLTVYRCK